MQFVSDRIILHKCRSIIYGIIHLIQGIACTVFGEIEGIASYPAVSGKVVCVVDIVWCDRNGNGFGIFFFFPDIRKEKDPRLNVTGSVPEVCEGFRELFVSSQYDGSVSENLRKLYLQPHIIS